MDTKGKTRIQTDHKPRRPEKSYRYLVENAADIIYATDAFGRFTFLNASATSLTGYTEKELLGHYFGKLVHPEYRKETENHYNTQLLRKISGTYYEFPILTKDEREFWVGQNVQLVMEEGDVIGFYAIARNITDRKRLEGALKESEQRMKYILESVHTGIVIIDAETHIITDVNPEASSLIGLPKEQIVDHVCHQYICPAEIGNCPITDKGQKVDNSERLLLTGDGRGIPILKSVASLEFGGRTHLVESFLDITLMKDLQVKLEHLARTDPLTGAHNRRYFIELNEKEIHRAWRSNLPLSIAMIDIDHFKRINDTHGHAIGDLVLKELVSICWDQIRPYDILGRVGGEEFGITLVDCDIQKASVVMERLRKSVEQHTVVSNGLEVNITISIGVAQLDNESDTWETVMNLADKALYRAKTAGRNRVETALK